uniref:Synaptobrevin, longin-like domain protein n=1 Tax=Tanacetum cinerariifolium TaxID=118510 RepID=A0A6L2MH75_TANCI|nr:hypothetical protein [Tanacetum cinerariifolium]
MTSLFAESHNMVAILEKSDAAQGFEQIIDFLSGSYIHYALTVNPHVYISCIKQFWNTAVVKRSGDVTRLQALVNKKRIMITREVVHEILQLNDSEDVICLLNDEIFAGLARMGYEKPSTKLTFYKAFFSTQWKFFIHTILHSLSAKRTSWNEFSSVMASALICLSSGQRFNFSKYIFESLVCNVDSTSKFYMYPRFIQLIIQSNIADLSKHTNRYISLVLTQKVFANMRRVGKGFSGVETPLFETMLAVRDIAEEAKAQIPAQDDDVQEHAEEEVATDVVSPTPTSPSPSSPVLDTCSTIVLRVKGLENANAAQQLEIIKLKARVKKLERLNKVKSSKLRRLKKWKKAINEEMVSLEKNQTCSLVRISARKKASQRLWLFKVKEDQNGRKSDVHQVGDEREVEVLRSFNWPPSELITDDVHRVPYVCRYKKVRALALFKGRELMTHLIMINSSINSIISSRMMRSSVEMTRVEELHINTLAETLTVKDKGKGILIEDPKPMKKKDQTREEMEKEDEEIIKSINETPAQKATKRRKPSEEAQEADNLRGRLEIVQDEDHDVFVEAIPLAQKVPVVDYQVVAIDNKPRYKIIRADDTHQFYISFTTLLKDFDREDLEALWRIVKDRFSTKKPTHFSDEYLLLTLKTMFRELDEHDAIWRNQKSVHGLALVKRWKLLTSCGVHAKVKAVQDAAAGHAKRTKKVTKLPQTSVRDLRADEAVYKEGTQVPRNHIGGADAQTRFETTSKKSRDAPLSEVNTSRSGEDRMEHSDDLTDFVPPTPHDSSLLGGYTLGSDKEEAQTTQDKVITRLKLRVRRLEEKRKARTSHPIKRRKFKGRVETSTDKSLGEDSSKQGKNDNKIEELNLTDGADTEVIVKDKGSGEKGGSTTNQVSNARPEVSAASVPANVKGVAFRDVEEPPRLTRSTTTLQPLPTIDLKDKDRAQKEKQKQDEATIVILTEEFDEIQARIDADHELAIRMTHKEQEKYTNEERGRFLAEYFERKKKQIVPERAEAIRNKPPTRTQIRNMMITYLIHIGNDEEESADYEHEKEELRMWLTVISDKEETVDPEILSTKEKVSPHQGIDGEDAELEARSLS